MIYAIKCNKWVKFGRAGLVEQRLADLQIGNPYRLRLIAVADWPDEHEAAIHSFLAPHHYRGEWFKDNISTRRVIEYMQDKIEGLALFRTLAMADNCYRRAWIPPTERNGQPAGAQ